MKNTKYLKQVGLAVCALLLYFLLPQFILVPFVLLEVELDKVPLILRVIYLIIGDLVLMAGIIYIFKEELKQKLLDLRLHHKEYFDKYLKYWFLALGLMMISNLIILIFTQVGASNQNTIEEILKKSPFYVFFSAVIFAPVVEELVFRLGLRYIFKTDWLFILMSGLLFGFLHIMNADNILNELIYLMPYSIPGFIFAYVLTKSKNIYVPMGLHFIHNGFLMAIQFIALIFG